MRLKKGKKPEVINISMNVTHQIMRIEDYIEIEVTDQAEITKLRNKGFTNL